MTLRNRPIAPIVLLAAVIVAAVAPASAQTAGAPYPAVTGLNQWITLTALDVTVGQAAAFISDQTNYTVVVDPRYRDIRVSLSGVEGTLAQIVSAVCIAANLEPRRLDRWIVLSPTARGIAVVAREMRAQYAPQLAADQARLAAQASAVATQAAQHVGLQTPGQVLSQLSDFQFGAFQTQGYLTVAQLFPDYYLPLYDVFGNVVGGPAERPPSLPEFAGTRVYLDPTLRLELHILGASGGAETVWPIDIIPAGQR